MKYPQKTVHFFMGSNTPNGFHSYFTQLQDPDFSWKLLLLKGGPGTGKSTLMKRIAASADGFVEEIHCSSDPDCLDAVLLHDSGRAVVDATSPHELEPRYPLSVEKLLDLASLADIHGMQAKRAEVIAVTDRIGEHHRDFCRLLRSAALLQNNNKTLITPYIDQQKLTHHAVRVCKRFCTDAAKGKEHIRMVSAFTPKGLLRFEDSISSLCDHVITLHDEYRCCAPFLLRKIKDLLLADGAEFYSLYSPYDAANELEGILIPSLSVGFITTTKELPYQHPSKNMHMTRFIDPAVLKEKKQRLRFTKKTATVLLEEGVTSLKAAKDLHDILESLYLPHMDFTPVQQAFERFYPTDEHPSPLL